MIINGKSTIKEVMLEMKKCDIMSAPLNNQISKQKEFSIIRQIIDLYLNQVDLHTSLDDLNLPFDYNLVLDNAERIKHFNMTNSIDSQENIDYLRKDNFIVNKLKSILGMEQDSSYENPFVLLDIVEEKMEVFYKALENMPLSIFISNSEGQIVYLNKRFENTTNINRENLIGKDFSLINDYNLLWPTITPIVLHEKRELSITQQINQSGVKTVVTGVPIFDKGEYLKWVVTASRELQKEELNAGNQEIKDLTKLKNKSLVFKSRRMKDIYHLTKQISSVNSTVLITGESGTGKDVIAELIHEQSNRKERPFIHINCGAIPDALLESELFGYESGAFSGASKLGKQGLIEAAHNGTLFLDEIGEMPLNLQVKLLQVIQNKRLTRVGSTNTIEVNIRIIAATNANLLERVEKGEFRLDLFYRLNVIPINIPPLRERVEDIIPLANTFHEKYSTKYKKDQQFTLQFEEELLNYSWPGNIRELDNIIERLVVTSNERFIERGSLKNNLIVHSTSLHTNYSKESITVQQIIPLNQALNYVESKLTNMAFEEVKNSYKVAKLLNISQSSAHRKIQKYVKKHYN